MEPLCSAKVTDDPSKVDLDYVLSISKEWCWGELPWKGEWASSRGGCSYDTR